MKSALNITRIFRRQSDGKTYVITSPHPVTKNEAWSFTDQQLGFLADSAGTDAATLKLVGPGCQLVVEGAPVKAGDTMTNRDGEVITFTKDHFRVDRTSIILSQQAQMTAAIAASVAGKFITLAPAMPAAAPAQPIEDSVDDDLFDEEPAPAAAQPAPAQQEAPF